MKVKTVRRITAVYFVIFLLAVIWPGFTLFNHVRPLILGLPFNLVVITAFILGGMGVLYLLYRTEGED